jgi:hypothetical protein
MSSLDNDYKTVVVRKIRQFYGDNCKYKDELSINTNKLNDLEFKKIIILCEKIQLEGKENRKNTQKTSFNESPTVDLLRITIKQDPDDFYKALNNIIIIYKKCIKLKTNNDLEESQILNSIKKIE